ncbi:MAG: Hsp33 family molecular chaperone HslO [Alphaproteobacteria bacterium]|nr:Hsp33 family molecular chaperone HslO [Alphaproteobacteria bacterium]
MSHAVMIADLLTPFMIEGAQVRGRVARLGGVASTILARYDYPPPVVQMLGELLAVAAMLSSSLKPEGILTIQIRGKGLVPLVVVDAVYGGAMRGYAEVSDEAAVAIAALAAPTPRALVGEGAYLAITFDPGAGMQRYQGIVELNGDSIAEAFGHYFTLSEQLDVELRLAVSVQAPWSAAGIMVERMPEAGEAATEENLEAWRYAKALLATVTDEELLDPLLDAPALLYRLFHEAGVRVYEPHALHVGCRCSRERIAAMLMGMPLADRADMIVEGAASVHCQFCNKAERFTPTELGLADRQ